jgi:hypothetical protein
MNDFYTYAYLREDKTPYYIGKGKGKRLYKKSKREVNSPKDKSRIIFLKQNLTEEEAFKHEIYMIAFFGRKDLGTGILRNKTDGGDGPSGAIRSEETKQKMSEARTGENNHFYGKSHTLETRNKLSERFSGENHPMYGKNHSQESRQKISKVHKGKIPWNKGKKGVQIPSEETKKKRSKAMKGRKWWNDSLGNCKLVLECPGDGWSLGRK